MSTSIWPPISPAELRQKEEESLIRELVWLLSSLQETFASLKAGLEECAALLSPDKGPSTLVLSSQRSESLKGYVTRVGTRIVKGDITLRLPTLGPPPKPQTAHRLTISTSPTAPTLILDQLTAVRSLINASLDIIDVSRWTGDAMNADFIAGQLRLLCENMGEAKAALKGEGVGVEGRSSSVEGRQGNGDGHEDGEERSGGQEWWEEEMDDTIFEPPLPPNLSFHLSISDAALLLHIRTLALAADHDPDSLRHRLAGAFGGPKPTHPPTHPHTTYIYKDQTVVVREHLKVETQDPALLSVMAKLSALEHGARMSATSLGVVMGKGE